MNCQCEGLLQRYLEAVSVWLPVKLRTDVAAEIAEDLRSRIDDSEAALGRPMNEDELVRMLRERGHPLVVAGSYMPQQYLIGPAWFPIYRFVLKLVILWVQLPLFALIIAPLKAVASSSPVSAILQTAASYIQAAIIASVVITIVFAALERQRVKGAPSWDPRKLRTLTLPRLILDTDPRTCARGLAQTVSSLVFMFGWIYLVQHWNSFQFSDLGARLEPVLKEIYWPMLLALITGVLQSAATILLPARSVARHGLRIANAIFTLMVVFYLFKMNALEQIWAPAQPSNPWVHLGLQLPFLIVAAIIVIDAGRELLQIRRFTPARG